MILQLPLDLFWFFTIELVCFLVGLKIISKFFEIELESSLTKILFSFGIGLSVFTILVFFLACFNLLYRPALIILVVALLIICSSQIKPFFTLCKDLIKSTGTNNFTGFDYMLLGIFVLVIF